MPDDHPTSDFDSQIAGIAALGDPSATSAVPVRRRSAVPVSRDQAAEGVGVARHIAKFHLDKLLEDGLLAVEFARAPGGVAQARAAGEALLALLTGARYQPSPAGVRIDRSAVRRGGDRGRTGRGRDRHSAREQLACDGSRPRTTSARPRRQAAWRGGTGRRRARC